nr:MAG TPA: dsDNA helicase [Caudoviricetes sp.]
MHNAGSGITSRDYTLNELYKLDRNGQPCRIYDNRVAEKVKGYISMFVLEGKAYIYDSGVYRLDEGEKRLRNIISTFVPDILVTYRSINSVVQLILSDEYLDVSLEDVNAYPPYVVNFKNGMLNIKTGELFPHDKEYRSINQIPHDYVPDADIKTSIFWEFLQSRVPDPEDRQMLLEYMGYCLCHTVIFQKFMILVGRGNAGKSQILDEVKRIVGNDNVSGIPLQRVGERFATAKLLGKQVNVCGDLSTDAVKDTSIIKQLTGEDLVQGEYKGGSIFFFKNTAKFLFSCNELPTILDERSNGFYRRLLIIRFNSEGEYIDDLHRKIRDEKDVEKVISGIILGAKTALLRGEISESGQSKMEILTLNAESDSVASFLNECCETGDPKTKERRSDLYAAYEKYCMEEGRKSLGKSSFFKSLGTKQFKATKMNGIFYVKGITMKFMETDEDIPFK